MLVLDEPLEELLLVVLREEPLVLREELLLVVLLVELVVGGLVVPLVQLLVELVVVVFRQWCSIIWLCAEEACGILEVRRGTTRMGVW